MPLQLDEWKLAFREWEDTFEKIALNPEVTLAALVHINLADLRAALVAHPSLFAYFSAKAETANIAEKRAKNQRDQVRAEVFNETSAPDVKLAIDKIKSLVEVHPRVKEAEEAYLKAVHTYKMLDRLCQSLEHRRDMLVQLNARQRKDLDNT